MGPRPWGGHQGAEELWARGQFSQQTPPLSNLPLLRLAHRPRPCRSRRQRGARPHRARAQQRQAPFSSLARALCWGSPPPTTEALRVA